MTTGTILSQIQTALADMTQGDFVDAGRRLLVTLGYSSERTLELSGEVDGFIREFPAKNEETKSKESFRKRTESVRIVFQFTDSEIAEAQPSLLERSDFDKGNSRSFMFIAVELSGKSYPRGAYVELTREINKRLRVPTVVLFRTADDRFSVSFVHRRQHKRDRTRDVLGSVSLIREIDTSEPHRAHLDVLSKLALSDRLSWMDDHRRQHNFDGLLDAWLDGLDTEELNRNFYKQLFSWFERAVKEAKFPANQVRTLRAEEHVIRLITRLLFVWFIKEKGLIAPELFIEEQTGPLLRDYDGENGDSYYRAVLQNLFFATLNTEIRERGFSKESNATHRDFSRYRYKAEIADPDRLLELFAQTPFINGGLFDCLDSFESTSEGGYRIDCFTDNLIDPKRNEFGILSIPNRLFFDNKGLISLFNGFQFTVEENTPAEQEVALDPELLGKVFENLLAAYNPETRDSARQQTGSYYTPREVVDYMVDESLVASLAQHHPPTDNGVDSWKQRLSNLLDYEDAFDDAHELFDEDEKEGLVGAIARIKLIDPAVGSGAFPMGALHKLTLALRRLDPDNQRWENLQKELAGKRASAAFDTRNQSERDAKLEEISATFEKYRDSDFGRKLYLIQNSIYGVDIQPIACQIARLRFFISLAIEQKPGREVAENYGIKPLPNLETRFVAANTLLALDTSGTQMNLTSSEVMDLQEKLNVNRERHFHATTRQHKLACKKKDRELRSELAVELKRIGMPANAADKVAFLDLYDQNAQADWFDSSYMFGVAEGFDLVIGNPPYIQLQKDGGALSKLYKDAGFSTFAARGDIYQLFYEQGCQILTPGKGILSFITSNSWLKANYGKSLRCYLSERHTPLRLLELGKDVFENAIVDTCILLLHEGKCDEIGQAVDMDRLVERRFPPEQSVWEFLYLNGERPWSVLSAVEREIMDKMEDLGTPLKEWDILIKYGIKTGYNEAFIIKDKIREALVAEDPNSDEIIRPVLRGKDVNRYRPRWAGYWLIVAKFGSYKTLPQEYPAVYEHLLQHEDALKARGQCRYSSSGKRKSNVDYAGQHHWLELDNNPKSEYIEMFTKEKLVWIELVEHGRFAYDECGFLGEATTFVMTGEHLKYLCGMLNAKLSRWFLLQTAPTSGMGTLRWKKSYVETIPIPKISKTGQNPITKLVDCILQAKDANPCANTSQMEAELDRLVYKLYGLTEEEISTVEGLS